MSLLCSRSLPTSLRLLVHARLASSQGPNAAFPFPKHPNPTPHEIFHLPPGASHNAIKSRYYELVRIYHPDSFSARTLPPSTAHSRFQAISEAYAALSGKRMSTPWVYNTSYDEVMRRNRTQWRASASSDEFGYRSRGRASSLAQEKKEKWDQGVLIFIVVFALTSTLLPLSMLSPFTIGITERRREEVRKILANARREARDHDSELDAACQRLVKRQEDSQSLRELSDV